MSNQQEIESLQQQLTDYRREFVYCLQQRAIYGTANLPYEMAKRLHEIREQIRQIKQTLQTMGVAEVEQCYPTQTPSPLMNGLHSFSKIPNELINKLFGCKCRLNNKVL